MRQPQRALLLLALAAATVIAVFLVVGNRGDALSPLRASWTATPGALNPAVTQSTIGRTICVHGWTTSIRPPVEYTNDLKRKQMREYSRRGGTADYQEDHLISLGLGGHPTDPRNLWPEPLEQALRVDRIERDLNKAVCAGWLTLADAQRRISALKHTAG